MTSAESTILQLLNDYDWNMFTKEQLYSKTSLTKHQLTNALESLIKSNTLLQLEKGKYCTYGFSDAFAIGCFTAHNACVSYWSAMNFHRLTEQIPNIVFIQTDKQKNNKPILGVRYQFIWLNKNKIFGYKTQNYGSQSYRISDLEKTIIDSFDMPKYSGGYPKIIKAFYKANLSADKLISYCKKMHNIALIKRLAFMADVFEKKTYRNL